MIYLKNKLWRNLYNINILLVYITPVLILVAFTNLSLLLRVIIAAVLAVAIWFSPFIRQLANNDSRVVNSANLFAVGYMLLFVVPGVYMAASPDVFENIRPQFINYYPKALALVCLAGYSFIITYLLFRNFKKGDFKDRRKIEINHKSFICILIAAIIIQIIIKIWLLGTGTYYHTDRTDYQFENQGILAIVYTLEEIVDICIYTFFIQCLKKKNGGLLIAIFLITIGLLWNLVGDSKSGIFKIFSAVLICLFLTKNIKFKAAFLGGLTVVIVIIYLMPFMDVYQYVLLGNHINPESISYGFKLNMFSESKEELSRKPQSPIELGILRLGDIRSLAAIYPLVPKPFSYKYGTTYLGILFSFIPHVIWPEKPDFEYRVEYMRIAIPTQTIASSPLTMVGEAYINGGIAGIIIIFFFIGFLSAKFDNFVVDRAYINPWWGGFLATEGYRIIWTSLVLGQVASPIIRMMLITGILSYVTTKSICLPKDGQFVNWKGRTGIYHGFSRLSKNFHIDTP